MTVPRLALHLARSYNGLEQSLSFAEEAHRFAAISLRFRFGSRVDQSVLNVRFGVNVRMLGLVRHYLGKLAEHYSAVPCSFAFRAPIELSRAGGQRRCQGRVSICCILWLWRLWRRAPVPVATAGRSRRSGLQRAVSADGHSHGNDCAVREYGLCCSISDGLDPRCRYLKCVLRLVMRIAKEPAQARSSLVACSISVALCAMLLAAQQGSAALLLVPSQRLCGLVRTTLMILVSRRYSFDDAVIRFRAGMKPGIQDKFEKAFTAEEMVGGPGWPLFRTECVCLG